MSDVRAEAEALLAKVEGSTPFYVNEVTMPSEQDAVIATIRGADRLPVLAPHPEAMSLLVGKRDIFDFIVDAPKVIRELLDELEKGSSKA